MKKTSSATERRRTTFERLEDRYLLTAAIVNTNLMDDGGNPLTTTLAEAIARVNGLPNESNTISFSITSGSVNNPDPSQINVNANLPIITAPNVLIDGSNVAQAGAPRMKFEVDPIGWAPNRVE